MGTAEIVVGGSNFGAHEGIEEIIYFTHGEGSVVVGQDTTKVGPGTTLYVPPAVRHGFINTGGQALQFVWVVSPAGLESHFRTRGMPVSGTCATH